MSTDRAGAFVSASPKERPPGQQPAAAHERTLLTVLLQYPGPIYLTNNSTFDRVDQLGFGSNNEVALNFRREFAKDLYDVSETVDRKISKEKRDIGDIDSADYEDKLREALTLSKGQRNLFLDGLRDLGHGLRNALHADMGKSLKKFGFLKGSSDEEPALMFEDDGNAPVLWDMMYEGDLQGKVDWEQFWGLRAPITYWKHQSRLKEIRLKKGLFYAIDEKLSFARRDVSLLTKRLTQALSYKSLADEIKERARRELKNSEAEQADTWLDEQDPKSWLNSFLEKLTSEDEDEFNAQATITQWKRDALLSIFRDPHFSYEMIHFACHCEPGQMSEIRSKLKISVAGAEVSLDVGSISEGREWGPDETGPLVFLNACGTGQQGETQEPPGFPDKWISKQGALAVVATLCPVPDLFAHAFAFKFYTTLLDSVTNPAASSRTRYVAEALLQTRRYFMEQCNNPLGLAYVLYAVQGAHLEI